MEKEIKELTKEVGELAEAEKKQASPIWTFLRGAMYGLGIFFGSAILAAVVIYVLSKLQSWGAVGSFIHQIIQNTGKKS